MVTIKEKTSSHGLPVVLVRNPSLNGVAATLFVRVGSAREAAENNGISHLLEHLIFRNAVRDKMEKHYPLNLELDAWTRKDFTCYEISHHKNYLDSILRILSESVSNIDLSEKEVAGQKEVIIQEMAEEKEDPFAFLEDRAEEFLYRGSPWGLPIPGQEGNIESINAEDLGNWYSKYYVPANMLLAVSGNFDTARARKLIDQLNFAAPESGVGRSYSLPPVGYNRDGKSFSESGSFSQAYLGLAFPVRMKLGDKNYFRHLLLADILGRELRRSRRHESDLYDLELNFHHYLSAGEIRLLTSTDPSKADRVLKKLLRQLQEVELSPDLFGKVRDMIQKQFLLKEDDIDDLGSLAMYKLAGKNKILTPKQEADEIGRVKFEDIKKARRDIIKESNCYSFKIK